jgi:hypothetical protein
MTTLGSAAVGQFYPDSSASWCCRTIGPMDWYYVIYYMGPSPDTTIAGQTYKLITEHSAQSGNFEYVRRYYVRSAADGKGYTYLPDSMAEYMTGDTAALAGDTLHNVLGWYDIYDGPCGQHGLEYALFDVIVDSTVTYTNNGVTVHRQFVNLPCAFDMNMPQPYFVFWQAGMGTSFGPLLRVGSPLGQNEVLDCANVAGVGQFSANGLPGGPPCCWPVHLEGVPEEVHDTRTIARPNPSNGVFELAPTNAASVEVIDATGHKLFTTRSSRIDLRGYPDGYYLAKVMGKRDVRTIRLVLIK